MTWLLIEQDKGAGGPDRASVRNDSIIILLNPNQAKLTVTFRYCVQELLIHLHKSAVDNMIFGFTNFRPSDTFPALRKLLGDQSVEFQLEPNNVYCFESYRFLAALNHWMKFDQYLENAYNRSW